MSTATLLTAEEFAQMTFDVPVEPDVLNESDQLRSDAVLPGFASTVAELFRGIG